MRFDRRQTSHASPLRGSRSRLTGLFIALALVILGIQLAADPHTWSWLFPLPQDQQQAQLDGGEVSFDVALQDGKSLRSDEIRSKPDAAPLESPMDGRGLLDGVDLSAIEDNTLGLRPGELEIERTLLKRLREISAKKLNELAEPAPTYRAVMLEPDHYRGQVFQIRGLARRIIELPAEPGAPPRYELWVFTRDSGINPWRVVSAGVPASLPRGQDDEGIPVRITGLFFKKQGYETQRHKLHVAPLILAKTVDDLRSRSRSAEPANLVPWILVGIIVGGIVIGIVLWRSHRSDSRFDERVLQKYKTPEDKRSEPEPDPASFLQQLSADSEIRDPGLGNRESERSASDSRPLDHD